MRGLFPLLPFFFPVAAYGNSAVEEVERVFGILQTILDLFQIVINIAIVLAFLFFFWNVVQFIMSKETNKVAEAKDKLLWSVIAIFVLTSVWGIVFFLYKIFIGDDGRSSGDRGVDASGRPIETLRLPVDPNVDPVPGTLADPANPGTLADPANPGTFVDPVPGTLADPANPGTFVDPVPGTLAPTPQGGTLSTGDGSWLIFTPGSEKASVTELVTLRVSVRREEDRNRIVLVTGNGIILVPQWFNSQEQTFDRGKDYVIDGQLHVQESALPSTREVCLKLKNRDSNGVPQSISFDNAGSACL